MLNSPGHISAQQRRALEAIDREEADRSMEIATLERRRRDLQYHIQEHDTSASFESPPHYSSPSSLIRARRRAFRPSERLQRTQERRDRSSRSDPSEALSAHPARGQTSPHMERDGITQGQIESGIHRESQARAKRRKLDDGTFEDEPKTFSYGDLGRVAPGPLKMEIISCDGGEYDAFNAGMTRAQHVLSDDANVYSTKSSRCNMLLKHVGGMPFTLTKIVFRAPKDGFDSPIQEGMVFVAMDDDKLLERTSKYESSYSPKHYRYHHHHHHHQYENQYHNHNRRYDYFRPSQEYLHSTRFPLRTVDRSRFYRDPHPPWTRHPESDPDLETSLIPGFNVSFDYPSDLDDSLSPVSSRPWHDQDGDYGFRSYTDRYRPSYGPNDEEGDVSESSSDSDDSGTPVLPEDNGEGREHDEVNERVAGRDVGIDENIVRQRRLLEVMRMARDQRDRDLHHLRNAHQQGDYHPDRESNIQRSPRVVEGTNHGITYTNFASDHSTKMGTSNSQSQATTSNTLAPHARFSIPWKKSQTVVNFDPPISGRYLLIKLWAQCPKANIDIQSMIAHGYGGPRFFPCVEVR